MANKLNERQLEAVQTVEGPLLIIAGAGSGKTTVIVNRIAYMISHCGINPWNILAITFTNKAANEMKERIEGILGEIPRGMWVGTFHAVCVKILRTCIDRLGYGNDFVIYDTGDIKTLIKDCIKELGYNEKEIDPRFAMSQISDAKNKMLEPATMVYTCGNDLKLQAVAKIYALYQKKLMKNNALDFDDIIFNTVKIFSSEPDVLERYQERFRYIMIDEYQDTDNSQYLLVKMLADKYRNLAVVGDDDQSIYRFRGANVENILGFEEDYPEARKIVLDRNYRSTENILNAANAVIANNSHRMEKKLWSDKGDGEKLTAYTAQDEKDEGRFIAREIIKRKKSGGRFSDCAVLYRTNAQSRAIETELMSANIPYKVLSGLRFYDRKEIKDIIAYLRLIHNPNDDMSLIRVINEPKRKIGATSVAKLNIIALENDISMFEAASRADEFPELKSAAAKMKGFVKLIDELAQMKEDTPVSELLSETEKRSGYIEMIVNENTVESRTRLENLGEFMTVAKDFEANEDYEGKLSEFLENVTLASSTDELSEEDDAAVLMTIHSAKGLEFPVVFIAGMEERIFPSMRSVSDPESLSEERRLCYVAMTRAKEKLYITKTEKRFMYGKTEHSMESRFWGEIPGAYKEEIPEKKKFYEYVHEKTSPKKKFHERSGLMFSLGKDSSETRGDSYKAGDRVEHKVFGKGTVTAVQPYKTGAVLQIQFDTAGHKVILADYDKLKKI
ncbi:MAG: ATP-dependent helicase [Monoglobales bacterium]